MPLEDLPPAPSSCLRCCHHPTQCQCPPGSTAHPIPWPHWLNSQHPCPWLPCYAGTHSVASPASRHQDPAPLHFCCSGPSSFCHLSHCLLLKLSVLGLNVDLLFLDNSIFLPTKWVPFRFTPYSVQLDPQWGLFGHFLFFFFSPFGHFLESMLDTLDAFSSCPMSHAWPEPEVTQPPGGSIHTWPVVCH